MKARLAASVVFAFGAAALFTRGLSAAETPKQPAGRLYFAPIGELSRISPTLLADYYQKKFQLAVEILPPVKISEAAKDQARNQLIAEELVSLIKKQNPLLADDPQAFIIGITEQDMYIRGKNWRFAFSYREGGRFAVVSTARMGLPSTAELPAFSQAADPNYLSPQFAARLRKMITKNIGVLYYQLPQSDNPKSVLYKGIMGIDELDQVGEDF